VIRVPLTPGETIDMDNSAVPLKGQAVQIRRLIAAAAIVAAVAGASAGPIAADAHAVNCPDWACSSNHNEVMATTLAR
jgi:hypothetical protein